MPAPNQGPGSSTLYKRRAYYTPGQKTEKPAAKKPDWLIKWQERWKRTMSNLSDTSKAKYQPGYYVRQMTTDNYQKPSQAGYDYAARYLAGKKQAQQKAAQKAQALYARNTYYTPPAPQAGSSLFPGGYTVAQGKALMAAYPNMDSSQQYLMKARGYNRWIEPEVLPYEQQNTQAGYGGSGYGRGGYGRGGYGGGGGYGDGGGYNGYTGYGGGQQQPNYRNYTPMADTPRWLSSLVNWRGPGG